MADDADTHEELIGHVLLGELAVPAFDLEDYKAARVREREGWEAEA